VIPLHGRAFWRAFVVALVITVGTAVGAVVHLFGLRAFIGPASRRLTNRRFESTPQRIARGKYLVEGVGHCFACHSPIDLNSKTGEPPAGQAGAGGSFQAGPGAPVLVLPNLTPDPETGIGRFTDDQLARAIREGINHDGQAMMPLMAYRDYRYMSDEDLASVIAFLRSRRPLRHVLPARKYPWKMQARWNRFPQPLLAPVPPPDFSDRIARGAYYIELGKCADCHTPEDDNDQPLPGLDFAGGVYLDEAGKATPNLTNDPSGISYYDEAIFIRVMRTGKVGARSLDPIMPWWYIGHMSDEDLGAMFADLRSLKPVHHRVDNSLPPTYCRLCRQKHGAGDQN
jgi:mono/diheme cytochrome c family protein